MTLAQTTELVGMFSLGGLFLRWRLKWIFAAGLGFGLLRFALCAVNGKLWVLAGTSLHGLSFTLYFITAQIYINERVGPEWRARAQAMMSLMINGVGNLIGYLGTGWWFSACKQPGGINGRFLGRSDHGGGCRNDLLYGHVSRKISGNDPAAGKWSGHKADPSAR